MMRKLIAYAFGAALALTSFSVSAADIHVRIGPPRPIVERRGPPPGSGYVWIDGYQRWDGNRYVWERGRWDRPPRPHARWHNHRWVKRHGEWYFVEGGWR